MKHRQGGAPGLLERLRNGIQPHHPSHVCKLFSNLPDIRRNIHGANVI